ncbi:MAG TPA: nodulation protein NfeD [Candidatus Krumholzibacteria bacterium]|nr:nodulation protein NfeD [Candidatus Krumholzibacteria bacterium]
MALVLAAGDAGPSRAESPPAASGPILLGHLDGPIGPASGIYVRRLLKLAEQRHAPCLILTLDTPGGLADTMRDIIQDILASPVPVVTFVYPEGARAASAGALIALSAHISAMAPGTNIGAAHPVSIGPGGESGKNDVMQEKVTNDAAAYARTIAARRGRDIKWAERVVRESISSTADEALAAHVIDVIARDPTDLVARIDGRHVDVAGADHVLQLTGAAIEECPPSWRERFLARISDPNIAYLLLLAGVFGIFFELQNPGAVLPGVVGTLALITGAFALQMLPVNWAGAALLALALLLFILDIKVTSHGVLTAGGVIAMLFGSIMLIDSPFPFMRVSLSVIIPSVIFTALFFLFAVGMGVRAQRRRVTTGREGLLGLHGVARGEVNAHGGSVFVRGEFWNAVSDEPIADGARVEVVRVEDMVLHVRPAASSS